MNFSTFFAFSTGISRAEKGRKKFKKTAPVWFIRVINTKFKGSKKIKKKRVELRATRNVRKKCYMTRASYKTICSIYSRVSQTMFRGILVFRVKIKKIKTPKFPLTLQSLFLVDRFGFYFEANSPWDHAIALYYEFKKNKNFLHFLPCRIREHF